MTDYLPFARKNWLLFVLGLLSISAGYLLLRLPPVDGSASLTVAPLLLVLGYCILIPLGLLLRTASRSDCGHSQSPRSDTATRVH